MNARDAHIGQSLDAVAERAGGDRSLLGYREVARTRRHDEDAAPAGRWRHVRWEVHRPAKIVHAGPGEALAERASHLVRSARDEKAAAPGVDALGDLHGVLDGLPLSEDDFGETVAERAVVVDGGEGELLDRRERELGERRLDVELPGRNLTQERQDAIAHHAAGAQSRVAGSAPSAGSSSTSPRSTAAR